MDTLNELRKKIDETDQQIVELLCLRMNLSKEIGEYKTQNNIAVFDAKREEELKAKIAKICDKKYLKEISQIYDLVLQLSKNLQL